MTGLYYTLNVRVLCDLSIRNFQTKHSSVSGVGSNVFLSVG